MVGFDKSPAQAFPLRLAEPAEIIVLNALDIDEGKPRGGSGIVMPNFVAVGDNWGFDVNRLGDRVVAWNGEDTVMLWQVDHPQITLIEEFRIIFDAHKDNFIIEKVSN